jgi:uncharacterized membrane protein
MKKERRFYLKTIGNYFLQGLLYVTPLGLTIYAIILVFNFMDGILRPYIENFLNFSIPGLGFLLILIFITFLGYIGQVAMPVKSIMERLIKKAPLLNMVYTSIRDFMEAFVGKDKKFNQPVLVKVNTISDLEKLGFVTQTDLSELNIKDKVAVYFPHSYNFSGELFIVPKENITPVNIPAGELMKFIVSGGITRV